MIIEAIKRLLSGEDLSSAEMKESMNEIMEGQAQPSQIGAFLALLRQKGETVNEITQAARVMRDKSEKISAGKELIDTCSTGGTGLNHFNISTTVAFVLAGSGLKVAKHGNRAATGCCGSADVLEKLGVNLKLSPAEVCTCIDDIGIGFMFAPVFHKAMKYAAVPRREISIRTIFNVLGPLTNPAGAERQVLGVFDPELTDVLAEVLGNLGSKAAMVVHGSGGLDEISLSGSTKVSELKDDRVVTYSLNPADFGLPEYTIEEIAGGDPQTNADITRDILSGERKGAMKDFVLANAACGLKISGVSDDLKDCVAAASESISSGRAMQKLQDLAALSSRLGG